MNLSHAELIQLCCDVLQSYNPSVESVDYHLNEFLNTIPNLDDRDSTFVEEVFTGCVRFDPILKVVVDGFYRTDGKFVLRVEESLYEVLTYLILFRTEELGISHLKKFVQAFDLNKMHKFLSFALDEKNIRTWMKDAWNKYYDWKYVDETILSPLLLRLPELKQLLTGVKKLIDNAKLPKKDRIPPVELKPFNLTQSKPIKIPVPERIPKLASTRPVPLTTYVEPEVDKEFQKAKMQNWKKAQKLYDEASKQSPSCATKTEKSERSKLRMKEYVENEEKKLNFNQRYCNPPPTSILTEVVPIKLNAAAILREGRLYQKREEEEIKRLEKLEAGYGHPSEFVDWQTKMRQQDLKREQMELERKRLEGLLSKEEAIIARQKLAQENKDRAAEMKSQAETLLQEFFQKRIVEEEHTRKLVEKVAITHENAREAKNRLQQYKAKIVQEMVEESRELMRQALEEAEIVMKQKIELINQIKEMESGRSIRQKLVDLTETSGCGLLCEMSIAELRERLHLLRMEETEQEENKRSEIFADKQMKEQLLMETIETIARHRTEQSKATANRLEEKRKNMERPKPKNETLIEMERMVEEKKAQRFRERESAKRANVKDHKEQPKQSNLQSKKSVSGENWNKEQSSLSATRSAALGKTSSAGTSRLALLAM